MVSDAETVKNICFFSGLNNNSLVLHPLSEVLSQGSKERCFYFDDVYMKSGSISKKVGAEFSLKTWETKNLASMDKKISQTKSNAVGFSLGALCCLYFQIKYAFFEKLVLVAPPLVTRPIKLLRQLNIQQVPSLTPRFLRRYAFLQIERYYLIEEMQKFLMKNIENIDYSNLLVILNRFDEFVPYPENKKIWLKKHVSGIEVFGEVRQKFRNHLFVHPSYASRSTWSYMANIIDNFLCCRSESS